MINQIKNHLSAYKEKYFQVFFLLFFLAVYGYYALTYAPVWWDEGVYIGMGKYLATGGAHGFWEFFRPPVLPLFYALVYKLHLPMILLGKSLIVCASVGLIWLVYTLTEKVRKGAGIWAGIFLGVTPVFFFFSRIPLSDILSAFLATLAIYFFLQKRDWASGLIIGITFLTRFPEGLVLVPVCLSLLYREYNEGPDYFKRVFMAGLKIVGGFLIPILPYLASNHFLYGEALAPIKSASAVVLLYNYIYFKGLWFYVHELWHTAPFLFFSVFSVNQIGEQLKSKSAKNIIFVTVLITAVIFVGYFSFQPHKELRYSIAFVPYLSILAGLGVAWTLDKVLFKYILRSVYILGIIIFVYLGRTYLLYQEVDPYKNLYDFFKDKNGTYISTTPIPAALSDILILDTFENYNATHSFEMAFEKNKDKIDGVIMSSSDIFCEEKSVGGSCEKEIEAIYAKLDKDFKLVYSENVGNYKATVYEKIK